MIMYRFATGLCVGVIATVLVGGTAFTPTSAEGATTSRADKVALKEATDACKAEAKDKNIKWPASRKYVSNCVARSVKDYHLDVDQLRRELNLAGLRRYT